MVQCDKCDKWYHFTCVKVTSEIEKEDWICQECFNNHDEDGKSIRSKAQTKGSSSKCSRRHRHNLALQRLEEEKELSDKREKEAHQRQAKLDKEYLDKRFELLMNFSSESEAEDDAVETQIMAKERVTDWLEKEPKAANEKQNDKGVMKLPQPARTATQLSMEFHHEVIKCQKPQPLQTSLANSNQNSGDYNAGRSYEQCHNNESQRQHLRQRENNHLNPSGNHYFEPNLPTAYQLAARQSLPNELPIFTGRSEEWPIFITMFEGTTLSCGFNQVENLLRLQKCLKGNAYEAVRSRLTQPKNVPRIIETLKETYGRPEVVLDSLIIRVQNEPAPRADKLESIIPFALAVDNICSTMEACDMFDHLYNPSVLRALVEKLPPTIKLQWASHMESLRDVNLITFGDWLTKLSRTINRVTFTSPNVNTKAERRGEKGHVNIHNEEKSQKIKTCRICQQQCNKIESCQQFNTMTLNEKWNAVKQNNLCRTCLHFHPKSRCSVNSKCGVNGCYFRHHKLLHNPKNDASSVAQCNAHQNKATSVLFRVLPIIIHGQNGKVKVYAFLDEGSSLSLMDDALQKELGIHGQADPLCLKWTGNTHRMEKDSKIVSLSVSGMNSTKKYRLNNIHTVKSLDLPVQTICMDNLVKRYPYLKGIPIEPYEQATPRILIGLDNANLGLPLKFKDGGRNDPLATKTRLGWVVYGPYENETSTKLPPKVDNHTHESFHHCECEQSTNIKLSDMLKDFFSLESLGIVPVQPQTAMSNEDKRALHILESETKRVNNHFETSLLWKYDHVQLPNSRPMAIRRFECLQKKLRREPSLRENLKHQINDYLSKGYIRKLTPEELHEDHSRIWYLPIFPVTNPNKPGKIRLVWDAAAQVNGVSLNSVLLKGPDQLTSLMGVLYRFRERKFAICGDIREMYHQVLIRNEDQHAQRFLWSQDDSQYEPDTYVMQVMTFGATCSPSSAQYVKNKNALEFQEAYPRAVRCITTNHYVDDLLESVDTEAEALQLATDVSMIHKHGGFEIGKWISNSSKVLTQLGESSTTSQRNLNISDAETAKVLGLWWCTSTDSFKFILNPINNGMLQTYRRPTKREVLRVLMSIFDPLGLIANYTIYLKILLQDIWRTPVEWDEPIGDEHFTRWLRWIKLLKQIEIISIPRCYLDKLKFDDDSETQLHIFVDASDKAYAAVAYIRVSSGGKVECRLVGAKSRVAPLKLVSIPRLELEAARLGCRFSAFIKENHSIKLSRSYFWTDSRTVLCWIRSDHRRYRQFVAFRVGEIVENTNINDWRYIPTKVNVADECTKWQKSPTFESSSRWYLGPSFLKHPEEDWPDDIPKTITTDEEVKSNLFIDKYKYRSECIINVKRFSKWKRLLRSQVYVFRFIFNCRSKRNKVPKRLGIISKDEYQEAENYLYRQAQLESYTKEVRILEAKDNLPYKEGKGLDASSNIYTLSPYLDNDKILRVRGRIDAAVGVSLGMKRPILLDRQTYLAGLIIQHYHEQYHHLNNETVINELRQRFWIPKIRVAVKHAIKNCQMCKIKKAVPQAPIMGDLPAARLSTFSRPFSFSGIDYFGPMTVAIGRRTEKRWGVIITCLTTRAIHIELANSLSSDSCILAIKRFTARRGIPLEFFSDNGTNFHGADRELQQAASISQSLAAEFTCSTTKWTFIPPSSPHMGGSWERMVRATKTVLKQVMPTRNPSDELLHSMMIEVERIINCHPLTYVPVETENDEALTPNHFLLGSSDGSKVDSIPTEEGILLRKNWMKVQQYANIFWKRWINEYLPTLTRRTKWHAPTKPIEKGDIVIVVDDSNPRNLWPKGRILDTVISKNSGQVRQVTVQTNSGIYVRPAVKIAVLDVFKDGKPTKDVVVPEGSVGNTATTSKTPPSSELLNLQLI
ncbi:uncharacterized protein LOC129944792 [Eupeodes corollae]|uniref:uncharacterized protein LOC129944792 n=1 Tax=Eupeodes corollae TaxID=290404 RepID=UPI0024924BF9|nr:uncharacterized protein LOC129944792 [Eupeodes corollae]